MTLSQSTQGRSEPSERPIMRALALLGRHGALRILWELRGASLTFRVLQANASTNSSLLNSRLSELRAAGIVAHADGGYRLTDEGLALLTVLMPLNRWAEEWAAGHPSKDVTADSYAPD